MIHDICLQASSPAPAVDCVRALKKLRTDRELAGIQRELTRLQEQGPAGDGTMDALLLKKQALLQRRESLIEVESRS